MLTISACGHSEGFLKRDGYIKSSIPGLAETVHAARDAMLINKCYAGAVGGRVEGESTLPRDGTVEYESELECHRPREEGRSTRDMYLD
jgi:hypothetical protein